MVRRAASAHHSPVEERESLPRSFCKLRRITTSYALCERRTEPKECQGLQEPRKRSYERVVRSGCNGMKRCTRKREQARGRLVLVR